MSRVILIAFTLAAIDVAAQTVEGHVVNAVTGISISAVAVNLVRFGEVAYSTNTDSQGHFRIDSVKAGAYTAHYSVPGFWPVPNFLVDEDFERECGRCFLKERGEMPFPVAAGSDQVHLEVKLWPCGKISGRVLDSLGEPVPNAAIQAHWGENWLCRLPSCSGLSWHTKTNEKGEYSVTELAAPGAWLLSAVAPASWKPPESRDGQRLAWVQTFYPGVTDPQLAVSVLMRFGAEISNLDIKLAPAPVHRIRGVVLDGRGNPVSGAAVTLTKGIASPALIRNTDAAGVFEFETVAEGEWRIYAKVEVGGPPLWTTRGVQLKAHDLDGVELRPAGPIAVRGKIVVEAPEGAVAPKPPDVTLAFNIGAAGLAGNPPRNLLTATPDAKSDFLIQNVYPGPYQIIPGPAPPRYYLDSIRIGGHDALDSDVEITPGAQPLTVAYKFGGGTVRGTVEKCAAGTVRLLPHDKAMWRPGFLLFAPCDSNDRYEIASVRPGEYYALAISGDSPIPWYATTWDDDGLVKFATSVTIRDGENSSADLRAIKP